MKDWVRLIIGGMFILLVCISTVHMNRKMNDVSGLREQITRLETELGKKEQQPVKETIGVGVNEKAALSSDKNCPFVYINFDFTLVNKVASL